MVYYLSIGLFLDIQASIDDFVRNPLSIFLPTLPISNSTI